MNTQEMLAKKTSITRIRHMGHPHIFTGKIQAPYSEGKERNSFGMHASEENIKLMHSWEKKYPHWWKEHMNNSNPLIQFVDGGIRIGKRFLLKDTIGESTMAYSEAVKRIEGFAPISKYLECFEYMPSGSSITGDIKKGYLQGDAIKELGELIQADGREYWSSTPFLEHKELAWFINFKFGYAASHKQTTTCALGYII